MKKFLIITGVALLLILMGTIWWRYYFVFGEGVKAGDLNFFVKKGYVFKTYEGRLIQKGFWSSTPGSLQSNEFEFSVVDDSIASVLEHCSGKKVELRYKEYLHPLPWRGKSNFVVNEILQVENTPTENLPPYQ